MLPSAFRVDEIHQTHHSTPQWNSQGQTHKFSSSKACTEMQPRTWCLWKWSVKNVPYESWTIMLLLRNYISASESPQTPLHFTFYLPVNTYGQYQTAGHMERQHRQQQPGAHIGDHAIIQCLHLTYRTVQIYIAGC
jgi:hypothetical protein